MQMMIRAPNGPPEETSRVLAIIETGEVGQPEEDHEITIHYRRPVEGRG
jgi:hypothetical protein